MTAYDFSEDVQHYLGAGMYGYITKLLDVAVLEKTYVDFPSGADQV